MTEQDAEVAAFLYLRTVRKETEKISKVIESVNDAELNPLEWERDAF